MRFSVLKKAYLYNELLVNLNVMYRPDRIIFPAILMKRFKQFGFDSFASFSAGSDCADHCVN